MDEKVLDGRKVAILVATDFEQVEMVEPRKALDNAGAQTVLIAPNNDVKYGEFTVVHGANGEVQGLNHDVKADKFRVDLALEDANPDDFDALLLPGGVVNADQLRMHDRARQFVRVIDEADKPIAVICHAPWLLISAGLVSGRTITSWPTLQDDIRNAGGHWVNNSVALDNNWVSSRGPADIPIFNITMVQLFAEWEDIRQFEFVIAA